jgi:protein-S-isoprenylcysteine O-methyltransferase Ste14
VDSQVSSAAADETWGTQLCDREVSKRNKRVAKRRRAKTDGGKGRAEKPQMSLKTRLVLGMLAALVLSIAGVFAPAGSWRFWQGWAFLAAFLIPVIFTFFYFYWHDREFLERRLHTKEQITEQKLLLKWGKPLYIAAFLLPGFDFRFGWSRSLVGAVPLWLTALSLGMIVGSMALIFWVFMVNRFASRTVRVEEGQTVITTGPYRVIRHPLYAAAVVLMVFMPTALGSFVACPAFFLLVPLYIIRLLNEEEVLRKDLPGYTEYCQRTRYRLIPFVW